ncbi:ribosome recycling factor [Xylaria sp. FL1777]|nr:ribosome recycling factor [Xylaria sp. FL1777]
MSNTAARTLLRHGFVRPQTGRMCVCSIDPLRLLANVLSSSYDVGRATNVGATVPYSAPYSTRPICQRCKRRPLLASTAPRSSPSQLYCVRSLHASPALSKSKKKEEPQKRGRSTDKPADNSAADDASKHPQPSPDEPLNFADVESRLQKHAEHFRASLKKMQTGARFDPDVIGGLQVTISKKTGEAYPLRELAQVVPRGGRAVSLLVHDEEYVKPIMSAVQASPQFNQQPQRDADNELELTLKVEPETREDLVKRVKAGAHEWRERVRAVRQKRDKLHVTWRKDGSLGPDLKRTADKDLDKIIKAAISEVDEAEKSTLKASE